MSNEPSRRLSLRTWVPYAVLALALSLTGVGTYAVYRSNVTQDMLRFEAAAEETRHLIEIRLNTYVELLRAASALFGASDAVSSDEFRAFTTQLRLIERYPGIQGIGFAARVHPSRLNAVAAQLRALGMDNPGVWPRGRRQEYTAIVFLEPLDARNRAALGFDMFTDATRREAMERARDSGGPAASGKVTLVQEIDASKQAGFLIYVPVYRNGLSLETVADRRAAITGWVYSPFRGDDLLRGILPESQAPIDYDVHDGSPDPDTLLHSSVSSQAPGPQAPLRTTHTVDVAGRRWTIVFTGYGHFSGSPIWLAPLVLIVGLLLSFALFGITLGQLRAWEASTRHASELRASEEAVRESEARLRRLVVLERESRAQAQAADRAKDEFLATLSHELRTPLNAVLGWIAMLRTGKMRDERRAHAMEIIERNARTQARLIEDLLDVSRIITGKVRIDLHPVQPGPIVQTAVDSLKPSADAKGVQIHVAVSPGAGPIMGDPARLQQIVWNLLSNAIKFTPPGGHVHVDLAREGDRIELRVRDTGLGIAPEFLPHVFERFRQADSSTTRTHSGVGLGLAIVRHLVELHGGTIEAHSEGQDRGALFVVSFPVAAIDRAVAAARSADGHGIPLDDIRVLVVDDDHDTREMVTEALGASGARVTSAASADEALAILRQQGADVLISDIGMPGVDGYALMRRIRTLPDERSRIPAIALTAYARPEDRNLAIEAGFQIHLAKPIELTALQEAVATLSAERTTRTSHAP